VPADGLVLDDVRGFVFDVDGTLAHRDSDGRAHPQPGAVAVLERIRASGRPFVLFTNGSHVEAAAIARGLREDGLPVADGEVLTPIESALTYLRRYHEGQRAVLFATDSIRRRMAGAGIEITEGEDGEVVFVAHVDQTDIESMERAARAVSRGARLLVGSYVRGYAGAQGMIISRGAMVAAAIAKAGGVRPKVVGKPSRAAVAELRAHMGMPTDQLAVIGDDLVMDVGLGRLGGSRTVLVRSGMSADVELDHVRPGARPHAVVGAVADLLELL
jgi:HAD superfamily hydrolase (TIGR01450 family)